MKSAESLRGIRQLFFGGLNYPNHDLSIQNKILRVLPLLVFIFGIYPISVSKILALDTLVIGDIDLWPSAETFVQLIASSWHDTPDGGSMKIYTPFVLAKAFIVFIVGQLAAGKVFLLLLLPASLISMFYASKVFTSSLIARYLAAFVYAFNPIAIGEFISASPLLAFYAILPLVLFSFVKLMQAKTVDKRRFLQFSLITSCSVIILLDSVIILPILLSVIASVFIVTHRQNAKIFVKNISISLAIISILVLPVIVGSYRSAGELDGNIYSVVNNPLNDVKYIYSKANLQNLAKLAGNEGTGMSQLGYNAPNQLWNTTGIIIPIMAFSIIFTKFDRHTKFLFISLAVVVVLIISFIWATKEHLTFSLFEAFPILFTFRNPRKLLFILSLAMSILFAVGTSQWFFRARENVKRKYISFAFMGMIMSLLLTYSWPLFSYDLGMTQARPTFPSAYQVPDRYFAIADEVQSNLPYEDSRIIWLPLNLITQYGVTGLDLNVYLLPSGGVLRGSDPSYYLSLYDVLLNEKTDEWGKWLSAANVRYVIVDKLAEQEGKPSLVYKWDTAFPSGDPLKYYDLLQKQIDLRLVVDKAEYAIFENTRTTSSFSVYDISALEYAKSADPETAYQYSITVDSLKLAKKSVNEYSVQGTTTKDLVVVINTKYDPLWTSNDSSIGDHFKAFNSSNGFIIKAGTVNGSVYYSYEQVYFVTSAIAYSAWAITLATILKPWIIPKIRREDQGISKLPSI